jgi:hypothetical protein
MVEQGLVTTQPLTLVAVVAEQPQPEVLGHLEAQQEAEEMELHLLCLGHP